MLDELKIGKARGMLEKNPDDLWAHRAYQDTLRQGPVYRRSAIDEYRAHLEKHSGDPEYLYLYGRVLVGTKTPDAIAAFDQALGKDGRFAPAHLAMVEVYRAPNFRDNQKAREHLEAWMRLCPEQLEGFRYLERMESSEFVRSEVARMRTLLDGRTDQEALGHYRTLWRLEFQTSPANEYARVKEGIRRDVAKLAKVDATDKAAAATLREGHKLVGDPVDAEDSPIGSDVTAMKTYSDWQTSHPYPKPDAKGVFDQNASKERNKAWLEASAGWVKQWPDDPFAWGQRLSAISMNRESTTDADAESAAEGLKRTKKAANAMSTPLFQIASLYLQRGMHLDQLPGLIQDGLNDLEAAPANEQVQSDLYSAPGMINPAIQQARNRNFGLSLLADVYLRTDKPDSAIEALARMRKNLDDKTPASSASDQDKQMWGYNEQTYWDKMGQIAEKQGRKLDALLYYQIGIRIGGTPGMGDYSRRKAKVIWNDLGGSEIAWNSFAGKVEAVKTFGIAGTREEWEKRDTVMPPFEITDLNGKSWHVVDMKGKTTLVNLWATWCGPCRMELPHLQKLYDKWKGRTDVQIITLNTDDNPGLIEPFMKENHYTFPVLPASAYVTGMLPSLSIPRNWIVNREGVLKEEAVGFSNIGEEAWIEQIAAKLKGFN